MMKKTNLFRKVISSTIIGVFTLSMIAGPTTPAWTQYVSTLPKPGEMVLLSPKFDPAVLKGLTIHPENPLLFDFLVNRGETDLSREDFKQETQKLIKYFLAAMTIPENESWVNLSPSESDRIIPDLLASTEMGKQMLEQDYLLKQLASSLTNPEKELGKKFWDTVYKRAFDLYKTTEIPVNTFNKVWIMPQKAVILEQDGYAFIGSSRLKVMMAEDYEKNLTPPNPLFKKEGEIATPSLNKQNNRVGAPATPSLDKEGEGGVLISNISSKIFRETILPEIEKEVNEGKNFAPVRQIYNSVILAAWYKKNLKETLLGKVYADKGKIKGVDIPEKDVKQKVYDQYLDAFRRGVYNLVKEDYDLASQDTLPRKYFSGGVKFGEAASSALETIRLDMNRLSREQIATISTFIEELLAKKRKTGKTPKDRDALRDTLYKILNGESNSIARALADAITDGNNLTQVKGLFGENLGESTVVSNAADFIFLAQTPEKVIGRINDAIKAFSDLLREDGTRSYSYSLIFEEFRKNGELNKLARELAALPANHKIYGTDITRETVLKPASAMTQQALQIIKDILVSRSNGTFPKPTEKYLVLLETSAKNGNTRRGSPEQWPGSITEMSWNSAGEKNGSLTRFWDPESNTSFIVFQPIKGETQEHIIAGNITTNPFLLASFDGDAQKLLKWLDEKVAESTDLLNGQKGLYSTILAAAWQSVKEFSRYETDPVINRLIIQIKALDSAAGKELTKQMAQAQTPQERQKILNEALSKIMLKISRDKVTDSTKIFETLLQLTTNIIDLKEKPDGNIQITYDAATDTSTINNVIANGDWRNTTLFDTIATSAEILSRLANVAKNTALTPQQQANLFQTLTKAATLEEKNFRLNTNKRYDPIVEMILAEALAIEPTKTAQWIVRAANNTPRERKESFANLLSTIVSNTNADNFLTETAKLLNLNLQPLATIAASSTIIPRMDGTIAISNQDGTSIITIIPSVSQSFPEITKTFKTDVDARLIPESLRAEDFRRLVLIAVDNTLSDEDQGALLKILLTVHNIPENEFAEKYSARVNEILAALGFVIYDKTLTSEAEVKEAFVKIVENQLPANLDKLIEIERLLNINSISLEKIGGTITIFYNTRTDESSFTVETTNFGGQQKTSSLYKLKGDWRNSDYSLASFTTAAGFNMYIGIVAAQAKTLTSRQQYDLLQILNKAGYITNSAFEPGENSSYVTAILNQIDQKAPDAMTILALMKNESNTQTLRQLFSELLPALLTENPTTFKAVGDALGISVASAGVTNTNVGGIDFNPELLDLQIKRDGRGVPLPLPMQNIDQINIEGLYPVILNIQPATIKNLPFLSEIQSQPPQEKLSLAK